MEPTTAIITHYGTGGSYHYILHLADALQKEHYPVIFYLPKGTDIRINDCSFCRAVLTDPSAHPLFLNIKLFKYPYHLLKYLYNAVIVRPEHNMRVAHLVFPFYLTDWITTARLKRRGMRVMLTVHEIVPHRPFLGGYIDKRLVKKMFESADLLIVHTESLKNELANLYFIAPAKIHVIHHGYFPCVSTSAAMDALKKKYHVPSGKRVLLFFGTIRENKGLDVLLHAMQELKSDYFLLLAGDTTGLSETPSEHYKKIIKEANLRDSVRWVKKYILNEEVAEIFKIADALVLPYRKTFHAQSGVLNLAIGYEKPCVVSDIRGIGDTVNNYNLGVTVTPEDASALISGVIRLFAREEPNYGFARYKQENSWQEVAKSLISEYEAETISVN
jgi:glycosyltransferase involved in cell wall biosynthesis